MMIKMYNRFISLDYLNICFLLLIFGIQCNSKELSCRKGFREVEGQCFAMVKYEKRDDRSWQSARTICIGLGGDLASLSSPKLVMAADSIRKAAKMDTLNMYWIGLTDEAEEGTFKWNNKMSLKSSEAPWLPGEPETSNASEDYVAASGVGWSDRANKWTRTVNKEVLEPTGFLCETKMFTPISENEEKSARPIIIEKQIFKDEIDTASKKKNPSGVFESAVVDKEQAEEPSDSSKNEKADDFFLPKGDLDFTATSYGDLGAAVYPPQSRKQHYPQHIGPNNQGYSGRSNFHPGYKPGRVHSPNHNSGYGNRGRKEYGQPSGGYGHKFQEKSHRPRQNSNRWYDNNNKHGNRFRESGSPRKQLRQSYPERHETPRYDSYKKKPHDKHLLNPYSVKLDNFMHNFQSYARKAPVTHYDPNKEGFCHKHKPGAHAHPYNCNKFIVCYSNYLATEFKCGYGRKWSGNTCIDDKSCNPQRHVPNPKRYRYFDPGKPVAEKADDPTKLPPSSTTSESATTTTKKP